MTISIFSDAFWGKMYEEEGLFAIRSLLTLKKGFRTFIFLSFESAAKLTLPPLP
jgi:hypothetical protein